MKFYYLTVGNLQPVVVAGLQMYRSCTASAASVPMKQ